MTEQRQLNKKLNVQRFNAFKLTMALCTIVDSNKLRLIKQACQNAQTARDQESEDTATKGGFQDSLPFSFQPSSSNKLSGLKISEEKAHFKRIPHPGHHQDYGSWMVCHLYHRGVLPCSFF